MIRGGYWGGAWGLSWGGAWGEAWLLLNQPYQELDLEGQIFVRSYLTSIHSVEVVERIVAVAAVNNISVIDAEVAITVSSSEDRREVVKKRSPSRIQQAEQAKQPTKKQPISLLAKHSQPVVLIERCSESAPVSSTGKRIDVLRNAMLVDLINFID